MKSAKIHNILTIALISIFLCPTSTIYATELDSSNFKIVGVTTSTGGGIGDSANYSLMLQAGEISADPSTYSNNYRINQDPSANFVAEIPAVRCFETDTNGTSTHCVSGSSAITTGGMQGVCSSMGCYNRARFEIDQRSNPKDTLFGIEISTDNFANDIKCISGATFAPKSENCNINDFRTKEYWEAPDFNIRNLDQSTTYYIRVTALHGDFTQSNYSQIANATTTSTVISFDIDIAPETGVTTESNPPYTVSFTMQDELVAGAATTTATNLIWFDLNTNSQGAVIALNSKHGGLYSPSTNYKIQSDTEDLNITDAEGFGLQKFLTTPTTLTANPAFSGTNGNVGGVTTTPRQIYTVAGFTENGRMGTYVKARASTSASPATDYEEYITVTVIPMY